MTHDETVIASIIHQEVAAGDLDGKMLQRIADECGARTKSRFRVDMTDTEIIATHMPEPHRIKVDQAPGYVDRPAHAIPPVRVPLSGRMAAH